MDDGADVGGVGDGRQAHGSDVGDVGGGGDDRRALDINSRYLGIHAVYLAANGLLYLPIQIKYENVESSPFETHMAMTSSVVALCVYFCATVLQILLMLTKTELDDTAVLLNHHVIICSGVLSLLSNMLVHLPNIVGWVVVASFVFATIILLAYDVFNCISKRNNSNNNNATPASESVAHNAERSESRLEISIEDNNETNRNNHDSVEMPTGTISQATNT